MRERRLTVARRAAVAVWALIVVYRTVTTGFAFNRELLLLYICTGLLAASIGQGRRMLYVVRDWLPFALVLVAYDLSRGAATLIGRPTMWHWQIDADRWMFFGTVPTVWLQERLKLPYPPWWEIVISTVYMSFFILPYVVAAVLWGLFAAPRAAATTTCSVTSITGMAFGAVDPTGTFVDPAALVSGIG